MPFLSLFSVVYSAIMSEARYLGKLPRKAFALITG